MRPSLLHVSITATSMIHADNACLDEVTSTACVAPPRPFRNLTPSLPRSRRPPASALRRPTYSSAWISLATRASLPSPVSPFSAASNSLTKRIKKEQKEQKER